MLPIIMGDTPRADTSISIDSRHHLSRHPAFSMSITEYFDALLDRERSPATRPSLASSSPPALAPVIIAQYIQSCNDRPGKKIAILRSKVQSWDGPVSFRAVPVLCSRLFNVQLLMFAGRRRKYLQVAQKETNASTGSVVYWLRSKCQSAN